MSKFFSVLTSPTLLIFLRSTVFVLVHLLRFGFNSFDVVRRVSAYQPQRSSVSFRSFVTFVLVGPCTWLSCLWRVNLWELRRLMIRGVELHGTRPGRVSWVPRIMGYEFYEPALAANAANCPSPISSKRISDEKMGRNCVKLENPQWNAYLWQSQKMPQICCHFTFVDIR